MLIVCLGVHVCVCACNYYLLFYTLLSSPVYLYSPFIDLPSSLIYVSQLRLGYCHLSTSIKRSLLRIFHTKT